MYIKNDEAIVLIVITVIKKTNDLINGQLKNELKITTALIINNVKINNKNKNPFSML